MAPVNTKSEDVAPEDLRAYCARHGVQYAQIAKRLGVSASYVSQVAWSDVNGKHVTAQQLRRMRKAAEAILWKRNSACPTT